MGKGFQYPRVKKMSGTVDRCDLCGGELRSGKTTLEIWRNGELIVLQDVPADVCQQCGEAYLSAEMSGKLGCFLAEHHRYRPERYIAVPEYSAAHTMTC